VERFRKFLIKILPYRVVEWYRRRRAIRRYMKGLSVEVLERERRLEHLEGRIAASTRGFYHQIVSDVLERTDIILQELDRRVEGVSARTEENVAELEAEMGRLRAELGKLRDELEGERVARAADEPSRPTVVAE
jgi:hypothetical protein